SARRQTGARAPPRSGHSQDRLYLKRRRPDSFFNCRAAYANAEVAFARRRLVRVTAIQPLAQFLAGAEERRTLLAHRNRLAGARIAPHAAGTDLDAESAETAQFDTVAVCQRLADGIQHRRHDALDIAVVEVRIAGRQARN